MISIRRDVLYVKEFGQRLRGQAALLGPDGVARVDVMMTAAAMREIASQLDPENSTQAPPRVVVGVEVARPWGRLECACVAWACASGVVSLAEMLAPYVRGVLS